MSRLTLAERIVIECGIYERLKLNEIAKKIGKSPESVSKEIRANRTVVQGLHHYGKDCRFAGDCKTKGLRKKERCSRRCVSCREYAPGRQDECSAMHRAGDFDVNSRIIAADSALMDMAILYGVDQTTGVVNES